MTTVLWCPCGTRCGEATREAGLVRVAPKNRPGRQRVQPVMLLALDRLMPAAEWTCTACRNRVSLDYELLQRVGRVRKLTCRSLLTTSEDDLANPL